MKKIFNFLVLLMLVISFTALTKYENIKVYAEGEENVFVLQEQRPYLFVDSGQLIDLTKNAYNATLGEVLLSTGVLSNLSSNLSVVGTTLTATTKGIHQFTFTTGEDSVVIYVFAKDPLETSYTIYNMSFSSLADGNIPSDYTLVKGSAGIENGYLYLDSPATSTPSVVTLPAYLQGFKNYIIETDFSILSAVEPTRWASIMYRYSPDNYFQMCIRQNATATNGIEFAKSINGNWNVPLTTSYSEQISSESIYRVKIDLFGSVVKEYINDTLLITYESANDYTKGLIGLQTSGSKAIFNNIVVNMPEEYIDNTSIDYSGIPNLYTPETNVITPPAAIKMMDSVEDIQALSNAVRPQTAVFRINSNLDVVQANGIAIMTIQEIFEYSNGNVVPAFYTKNREVAVAIATLLKSYSVRDVFLISPNDDALQGAREEYNMIRGVLEIPYDSSKPVLSDADLLQIRDNTNSSGAIVAKLASEYTTQYNVYYLQKRLVSVWSDTFELTTNDVVSALISGVNGIIVDNYEYLYDLFMHFPVNTLLQRPMVIAHRGLPMIAPENTLTGMDLAIEANVDVVELDIYLTTDNEIVVIHDGNTTRTTNKTLIVEDSTLAQLRALTILDSYGYDYTIQIPTLREYFDHIQGKDVMLFIEIKSGDPEIVDYLKLLIDEYQNSDQIVIITFNATQIVKMKEVLPQISNGYLSTGLLNSSNLESSIRATLNSVVPIQTTINPEYSQLTSEYIVQMNYRGLSVWPWTIDTDQAYYGYFLKGVGGITSNYSTKLSNEFTRFHINQTEYQLDLYNTEPSLIRGVIGTQAGFEYNFVPTLEIFDDGGTGLVLGESSNIVSASSTGDAYLLASFTTTLLSGDTLTLYSELIHVSVVNTTPAIEDPVDDPVDDPVVDPTDDPVNNPIGWIITGIVGGVAILSGGIFLGLRFLKKPKI